MMPIKGIFEIAIKVKDLAKAEAFYLDALGLEVGIRDEKRNWLFLWAGGRSGMVVLQEEKGAFPLQHFAFEIAEEDIEKAAGMLRHKGIDFEGPIFHEWMNSASIYFKDPDGNDLEFIALKG